MGTDEPGYQWYKPGFPTSVLSRHRIGIHAFGQMGLGEPLLFLLLVATLMTRCAGLYVRETP